MGCLPGCMLSSSEPENVVRAMRQYSFFTIIISVLLSVVGGCSKQFTNEPKANMPPSTRLWLTPDSVLLETSSRQHLYWYGEDPDGMVQGYLLAVGNYKPAPTKIPSPDTMTYTWVTITDTLIALPLRAIRDSFTVVGTCGRQHVQAVANFARGSHHPDDPDTVLGQRHQRHI